MSEWGGTLLAHARRAAEIRAMQIAAAFERADPSLKVEHKSGTVRVAARGLFNRMIGEASLRFARRWGR